MKALHISLLLILVFSLVLLHSKSVFATYKLSLINSIGAKCSLTIYHSSDRILLKEELRRGCEQ